MEDGFLFDRKAMTIKLEKNSIPLKTGKCKSESLLGMEGIFISEASNDRAQK